MENKQPWLCEGSPWKNESQFVTWVRGILRKGWSRYPLKHIYKQSRRKRIKNPAEKPRKGAEEVWGIECEICHTDHRQDNVEIDHIGDQGILRTMSDVQEYVQHLFMLTYEDMRAICKPCHKVVSYSQKMGISFEEAQIEKQVIEICKKPVKQILAFCTDYGYDSKELSNPEKRRKAVQTILRSV